MVTQHAFKGSPFLKEVLDETPGGEQLVHCLQCGTCGGSCPSGDAMSHTPRKIFAMINAGERKEVLTSNTMWNCVSCYYCTSRCPQKIPITDIMYSLKRISARSGLAKGTTAPALAKSFTYWVEHYGRTFEIGLALMYYTFNKPIPLMKMGMSMGPKMFLRGRMGLLPTKIRNTQQLQAIIKKAKELGGQS